MAIHMCDCDHSCPVHPHKRLVHVEGICLHTDGTHHKVIPRISDVFRTRLDN